MSRTQAEVTSLLSQLRNRYNNHKVDYWGYPGECVSYFRRWLDALINGSLDGQMVSPPAPGGADGYGAYYWSQPTDAIRALFDVLPYDPNAQYPAGSGFIYTKSGHVGIMLDNQPGNANALVSEQNADPDGSPVGDHQRSKSRINGILVLKIAPPPPTALLWTVQPIEWKDVKVRPGQRKWNLAHGNFKDVSENPITTAQDNEVFTAKAILHHREIPQYNYYLEDPNTPHGWNVLDCIDYAPPPPPYVPPAPPVTPVLAEKYTVITRLMRFDKGTDALVHSNTSGDIEPGQYFVIAKLHEAYNLSDDNMKDRGWWVNVADNVVPVPAPAPVATQPVDIVTPDIEPVDPPQMLSAFKYFTINPDGKARLYRSINTAPVDVTELDHRHGALPLKPNWSGECTYFAMVDGLPMYIPDKLLNTEGAYHFGIPKNLLREVEVAPPKPAPVAPKPGRLDKDGNGKVSVSEAIEGISGYITTPSKRAYTQLKPIIQKTQVFAKTNGKQFIEGIRKAKK